ncbi:hypothetical protein CKSOR_00176 [Candidatus Kinetoplastibacterium sorsogonicusi]|uniref:DNA-directed DNA polymerase n=1 Tax=Candidatus Kinetoplastidibacterium kentomonadis TaxID=1576550 RepID=A0A3S7J9F2_9PROT|nr:hypothetical protein [Candidatus Kinetoplastibacterium sorsogonicusi]AWD32303.1 hypothetical protein CKSOR_00176 [Candidatus Kinetoplastibacterium sorsogonicusi]
MQITFNHLDNNENYYFLIKNKAKIYLVYSDELFLLNETIDNIYTIYVKLDYELIKINISSLEDINYLNEHFNNISLLNNKKIINIKLNNKKYFNIITDIIKNLLNQNNEIFVEIKIIISILDNNFPLLKNNELFQLINNYGIVIKIPKITKNILGMWIQKRLYLQNQILDLNSCNWIASMVEGNLLAAYQEIIKLGLIFYNKKQLFLEDIKRIIVNSSKFNLYDLRKNILLGDTNKSINILKKLQYEGENISLIIWGIVEDMYNIQKIDHNILKRLSIKDSFKILEYLHMLDCMIKGFKTTNINTWDFLEMIVISITNPKFLTLLKHKKALI